MRTKRTLAGDLRATPEFTGSSQKRMPAPVPGQLIAGLLRPAAYPHPVHEPIRVAETHISWVLLTGEFAYKVKKPIRLSFLDYSTLDRRRALCEEELRLNRRLAPDLYLGVSTICGPTAAPRVDGGGEAVEYVGEWDLPLSRPLYAAFELYMRRRG